MYVNVCVYLYNYVIYVILIIMNSKPVHFQLVMEVYILPILVTSGAYERHEGASNSSIFCKPSVVKSHLCKLPYRVHYYKLRK